MKSVFLFLLLASQVTFSQDLKIMSYNIRLDTQSDGDNQWSKRKEFLTDQVKFYMPDFMGVQEALPQQMSYIDSTLTGYGFIGKGRDDGKSKGEHSAIFYNSDKFKLLEENTFWLSETPEKPSKGWDAAYNRVCTYGLFQNKKNKKKVWVFNTHFDHVGDIARAESSKLILEKIRKINRDNLPVILTGDFNLEADTRPLQLIKEQMDDAQKVCRGIVFGPEGTFNAFEFNKPVTTRIDYIFINRNTMEVVKFATLSDSKDCRYPSDHLPIYAEINFR
jgi:endonuclease/exonuclease/phosphatase family metal-dependent hydrolase